MERTAAEFGPQEMSRDAMATASVQDLLDAFNRLGRPDQAEFVSEILRRTRELAWPPLDDETLARIADESFLEYDAREAQQTEKAEVIRPGFSETNKHE